MLIIDLSEYIIFIFFSAGLHTMLHISLKVHNLATIFDKFYGCSSFTSATSGANIYSTNWFTIKYPDQQFIINLYAPSQKWRDKTPKEIIIDNLK